MNPQHFISKTEQKKSVYFSTKVSLKPGKVATYFFHSNKISQLSEFMIKSLFYIFPAAPQNLLLSVIQQFSNIHLLKVSYSQDQFVFIASRTTMVSDTMKLRLPLSFLSNQNKARSRTLEKTQTQVVDIVTISKAVLKYKYYPKHRNQFFLLSQIDKPTDPQAKTSNITFHSTWKAHNFNSPFASRKCRNMCMSSEFSIADTSLLKLLLKTIDNSDNETQLKHTCRMKK